VAYYRVSTARQGQSGLGLEAQREAVGNHLKGSLPVAEFVEIESGKRNDRPKLKEALAECELLGATLVIAKLDRLARNLAFIANLMETGVEFEAVDLPQANRFTVHILAAVAEHEARMISERTKAALAQSKKKLGGPRIKRSTGELWSVERVQHLGVPKAIAARQLNARRRHDRVYPRIAKLRASGLSWPALAAKLNADGVPAPRGGLWHANSVRRVLTRDKPIDQVREERAA
jgi:DNA invertase Pin-like site-specific DNA recombinase